MKQEQSRRIQTSVLNAAEKRVLVWLAQRQPRWVTSDGLTAIGVAGAIIVALGYILSNYHIGWLWLASLGFVINWYGDSLDGTLARVRGLERPIYGFFLDHNVDGITMAIMCIGAGLSGMLNLYIAMAVLAVYLMLSISVYINAHLKNEFKAKRLNGVDIAGWISGGYDNEEAIEVGGINYITTKSNFSSGCWYAVSVDKQNRKLNLISSDKNIITVEY